MNHNNIDLSLRVFDSDLKFVVSDNEIKLVLNKDLKLRLNFDTDSNIIVLDNPSKDVDEVLKDDIEDNEDDIEDSKNDTDTNVGSIDEDIVESKEDTYWENGILKHREKPEVVEDNTYIPVEVKELPKSSKRGRPPKVVLCYYCGGQVERDQKLKINDRPVCSKCALKFREKLKKDLFKLRNEEEE